MSDINYSVSYRVSKGFLNNNVQASGITATMENAGMFSQTLTLSTSAVNVSTGSLTTPGVAFLQNLSTATASTVAFGVGAGGSFIPFINLRAGEPAILRLAEQTGGVTYQATGVEGSRLRVDITEG